MMDHIKHIYTLRIENTTESDPRSYEATKAAARKALIPNEKRYCRTKD